MVDAITPACGPRRFVGNHRGRRRYASEYLDGDVGKERIRR